MIAPRTVLAAVLLVLCCATVWWFVRRDVGEYAAFKTLEDTAARQARYRVWILRSFALFTGSTIAALAIIGRLRALLVLPPEFAPLSLALRSIVSQRAAYGFLMGLAGGGLAGGVAIGILLRKRGRSHGAARTVGDIAPLMPRNGAETVHAALLSLNAGVSEELFFRLLLPLLLVMLAGSLVAAMVIADLIFGAVHLYQGPAGIVVTTILGLLLSVLYLATGSIWIAVGAHALLDLIGLVVRPTLARRLSHH